MTYVPGHRQAHAQRQLRRARRRHFRPSRQSSRPAAGQARLQWRGRARQFHARSSISPPGADVWANGRGRRRAAGRRAAAHARPQLAPRRACAGRRPPGLRGRDDAQGRRPVQRRFEHRDARRLHLVSAAARLDFEGGKSADDLLDLKVHAGAIPGATHDRKTRPQRIDHRARSRARRPKALSTPARSMSSKARSTVSKRASARVPIGPLNEEKTRIAVRGPGGGERPCARRPRFRPRGRPRADADMRGSRLVGRAT